MSNIVLKTITYDEVSSTNTILKEMAENGAAEGTVIIANSQTEGRGRVGKKFFSPKNTGLYLSILLKPNINPEDAWKLTCASAVAVARAIEEISDVDAKIKWVNDIFINNKKVSGILTESKINPDTNKLDYAIVGIGINLCKPAGGFPNELKEIATAVFDSSNMANQRQSLIDCLLDNFLKIYTSNEDAFINEYVNRSIVLGKKITFSKGDALEIARAIDIDSQCRLIVEDKDGNIMTLSFGEVSIDLYS